MMGSVLQQSKHSMLSQSRVPDDVQNQNGACRLNIAKQTNNYNKKKRTTMPGVHLMSAKRIRGRSGHTDGIVCTPAQVCLEFREGGGGTEARRHVSGRVRCFAPADQPVASFGGSLLLSLMQACLCADQPGASLGGSLLLSLMQACNRRVLSYIQFLQSRMKTELFVGPTKIVQPSQSSTFTADMWSNKYLWSCFFGGKGKIKMTMTLCWNR